LTIDYPILTLRLHKSVKYTAMHRVFKKKTSDHNLGRDIIVLDVSVTMIWITSI